MSEDKKHNNKHSEPEQDGGQREFTFDSKPSGGIKTTLLWLGAIALIGGAIVAGSHWIQSIRVDKIKIKGVHLAQTAEIRNQASFALGMQRDSLSLLNVQNRVQKIDFVRDVSASVNLFGTLELQIEERDPIAVLSDNNPKVWVDNQGVVLPLLLGHTINVPLIHGIQGYNVGDTVQKKPFQKINRFLQAARSDGFTWSTISEVYHQPVQGVIAVSSEPSVRLLFGDGEYERKMDYWKAYYSQVLKYKKDPEHDEIDLRYEGQIVTR